ncbi:tripartite tricarboxylate transporter TctB family protein [Pseudomonas sp. Q11]|uniref:tripartite tricarboxylate transporter TctB family protein n=1 Tax=Pseudomonas sp. Q11 TaxID=2968470 RepID=UPI0021096011|nr:tripartite tricarboxylate transporter TctB family protein [Pseudomonas sp. Q11]
MNSTIILGIAAILFALVFRAQTDIFPAVAQRLPVLLIWLVVVLAVMMIIEEVLKRRSARRAEAKGDTQIDVDVLPAINWFVLSLFGAAIVTYVALISIVGYLVMTPLFITGTLLVSRTVSLLKAVMIGVIATALVWLVFIWALNLPVPILPFLK